MMMVDSGLADWMDNLSDSVKERSINRIVMPMAHDCAASGVAASLSTSNSETKAIRVSRAMRLPVVRTIIAEFATCQELDIVRLLDCGVRCLDVRVTYDDRRNAFVCSHCVAFPQSDFVAIVNAVARFLSIHRGELIVVNLQDDWDHRKNLRPLQSRSVFKSSNLYRRQGTATNTVLLDDNNEDAHALQTPSDTLGEWLANHSPLASLLIERTDKLPSLSKCVLENKRCLIITRPSISPDASRCSPLTVRRLFPSEAIDGHWPDSSTTIDLEQKCRSRIASHSSSSSNNDALFTTLAFTHTADATVIKAAVKSKFLCQPRRNLKSLSWESRALFDQFLTDPQLTKLMKQFSSIQFDFNDAALNRKIISLNNI